MSIYLWITCPPQAQPLPLNSRNVGMFRRQLYDDATLFLKPGKEAASSGAPE
jgi:hypothetical protein